MNFPAALSLAATLVGFGVAGLALAVGSTPRWARFRLLSVTSVLASFYCLAELTTVLDVRPAIIVVVMRLQGAVAALYVLCWHVYACRHLELKPMRGESAFRALLLGIACIWPIPNLFLLDTTNGFSVPWLNVAYRFPETTVWTDIVFTVELACLLVPFVRYIRAMRRGVEGAGVHVAVMAVVFLTAIHDSFVGVRSYQAPFLLSIGFIVSVGAIGVLLGRSFVADARALDTLRQSLEDLVDDRTKELVAAEAALMRSEKLAALGQLSAGVAHEINNPAAAVAANIQYLRDELEAGKVPADGIESLNDSLEAVDRIAKIVRQLLDLGRAAATEMSQTTVLSRAVQQALVTARTSLSAAIDVSAEIPDDLYARADEPSMVQILVNVIVNAAQAIPDHRRGGRIMIRGGRREGFVFVTVVDDGEGMSDETKRRMFEPFYTTKPMGQGTGLGLSLCLGIVRSLGGSIEVDSRPGRTAIRIEIPAAQGLALTSSGRVRSAGRRRSLLLVEDDDRVRKALARSLSTEFVLEVAPDVGAALTRLDDGAFDVVLSDWTVDGGGGRRLFEEVLRRRPERARSLFFYSSGGMSEDDRLFLDRHASPVLEKPIRMDSLLEAVARAEQR